MHRPVILASQSPRRKELLAQMGVQFTVLPSQFEEHLDHARPIEEVAIELALGKAHDVAKKHPKAIVIGADTIVLVDGKQLGKPKDESEAYATLHNLAGKTNQVGTGLAVVCLELQFEVVEAVLANVHFKPANKKLIDEYIATGDWRDKAGSYGIQSGAAPLIDYIEGAYDNILGLPTATLADILQNLGVQCHPAKPAPPVPMH
ncbi:MAG TPA: Maf family protein [Candidatus Saccharimonadales bacterium]|nr:Maf family protein [Candidatus Saccharimonadales bacterium]